MAKEIQPKKKIVTETPSNLESGYMRAASKTVVVESKEHRLTIDLSNELFTQMDEHRKETGQSYKGLITLLLKNFFKEK
jgi:hypothetical protein